METTYKEWLTVKDIGEMLGYQADAARRFIREIKSISDIGGKSGRVLWEDYENWKEYRRQIAIKNNKTKF